MPKGIVNKSDEFRKLLFQQSERYNIPFTHLCHRIGVSYERFIETYANIADLERKDSDIGIFDEKLIEIGNLLGIDVRMVIVIKDEKKHEVDIIEIKKKLKDEYNNRKKERDASGTP